MRSPGGHGQLPPNEIVTRWNNTLNTGEVVLNTTSAPEDALLSSFPDWMAPRLKDALRNMGIDKPYAHQVTAWNHLHSGKHTVVATPTASGKTICYTVPVVNRILADPEATALFLFPTKALARDQEKAIGALLQGVDSGAVVAPYDGDTPSDARREIRTKARLIVSNPDMLHMGILPHHSDWANFFSGLSFVVIDELHMYRGVFGAHVSNVIRRLLRVARFYGANPTFAACSATIANPSELAEKVVGQNVQTVSKSTAPKGPRTLAIFNPATIDEETGVRRSNLKETARLSADLVRMGLQTLVFCQSRRSVELVLTYLRERIASSGLDPKRVKGYRGGYLPTVRREIESLLANGHLDAGVATNALELGIDIGSLDAVVMGGYPGTIAGFHQRAGRAGRTFAPSLALLVASADPVDQFLAKNQSYLLEKSPEQALTEPDNVEVLLAHLKCAIFELPIDITEPFANLELEESAVALDCLIEEGDVALSNGRVHWVGESYPASRVSLRSISGKRIVVEESDSETLIAEVDERTAKSELHEGAIYMADGQTYFVEKLDLPAERALVAAVSPTYYTRPHRTIGVTIIDKGDDKSLGGAEMTRGNLNIKESISGFKKVRFKTHENLGFEPLTLPPDEMETDGAWLTPSPNLLGILEQFPKAILMDGFNGVGYALHQVASLHLMCDQRDLAFTVQNTGEDPSNLESAGSLYLYDTHVGGVGLSHRAYDRIDEILMDSRQLIDSCQCKEGCPSCIGPTGKNESDPEKSVKTAAMALLGGILGLRRIK